LLKLLKIVLTTKKEELQLLNSFQKSIFNQQSAARGPGPLLATLLIRYYITYAH